MRRVFFTCIIVLISSISLVRGQSGNLISVIEARRDLGIFAEFVRASDPALQHLLETGETFTVFAPNDRAFQNLASLLDKPLAELLANPAIVTQLVQYHVIGGANSTDRLQQLQGQVIPTQLRGAYVGIQVADSGMLSVNNVVEVVVPNLNASNGVIHIVNDVLLNRMIATQLEDTNALNVITPNPNVADDTPQPSPAAPLASDGEVQVSNIRLVNVNTDEKNVAFYVNEVAMQESVVASGVSDFFSLLPDTYRISFSEEGEAPTVTLTEPFAITLEAGTFTTFLLTGSTEISFEVHTLIEDLYQQSTDQAQWSVIHAVQGAADLDLQVDSETLANHLAFGEIASVTIPSGRFEPHVVLSSEPGRDFVEIPMMLARGGNYYLTILAGTSESPKVETAILESRTIERLRDGSALVAAQSQFDDEATTKLDTILDQLLVHDDFSLLIEALEAANPKVINRLNAEQLDPITFLAPTDLAIRNLLQAAGISQAALFNDRELLTAILQYHMVEGEFRSEDFAAAAGASMLTLLRPNQAFRITVTTSGVVRLNGVVQFVETDIQASNGLIHSVDDVLLPQSALIALGL